MNELLAEDRKMRLKNTLLLAIFLLWTAFLSGCGLKNITVIYVPKEADAFARDYLEMLRKGDIDGAVSVTNKDFLTDKARGQFMTVSKLLDKGELIGAEVVKFQNMKGYFSKEKKTFIDYQLQFEKGWVEAIIVVDDVNGKRSVAGLYVEPLPKSLKEIHSENFYAKPLPQYMLASLTVIIPVFIFYTFMICLTTPLRMKALWVVFIIIGLGRFSLDWTTGLVAFYPFSLLFFGGEALKDGIYGPWVLSFSFPLGAIAFHVYNRMRPARIGAESGGAPGGESAGEGA